MSNGISGLPPPRYSYQPRGQQPGFGGPLDGSVRATQGPLRFEWGSTLSSEAVVSEWDDSPHLAQAKEKLKEALESKGVGSEVPRLSSELVARVLRAGQHGVELEDGTVLKPNPHDAGTDEWYEYGMKTGVFVGLTKEFGSLQYAVEKKSFGWMEHRARARDNAQADLEGLVRTQAEANEIFAQLARSNEAADVKLIAGRAYGSRGRHSENDNSWIENGENDDSNRTAGFADIYRYMMRDPANFFNHRTREKVDLYSIWGQSFLVGIKDLAQEQEMNLEADVTQLRADLAMEHSHFELRERALLSNLSPGERAELRAYAQQLSEERGKRTSEPKVFEDPNPISAEPWTASSEEEGIQTWHS